MIGDRAGRFMYGYRFTEIDPAILKIDRTKIKKDLKIISSLVNEEMEPERLPVSRTLPIYFELAKPRPCPNHPPQAVISLLKRTGTKPPPGSSELRRLIKVFMRSFCERTFVPLSTEEIDFENWVSNINQTSERKEELRKRWYENPFEDPYIVKKGTQVKSFLKDEPYDTIKAARAINARDDWFKAYWGPVADAIAKQVFALDEFIKTVPVLERPDDISEALADEFGKILNMDASSYEAHFIKIVMECIQFEAYRYFGRDSDVVMYRILKVIEVLGGKNCLIFKYIVAIIEATRMSGEMDTSLGNGLTTLILNLFLAWLKKIRVQLRCEGDDNLSLWSDAKLAPTDADWVELGWIMKVEEPESVATASFCGNVFDPDDKIVVTDPRDALANFGWVGKRYVKASERLLLQLLRSKGLSMAHQYNGCPMLGAFGRRVVQLTEGVVIRQSVVNNMDAYQREKYLQSVKGPLPEYKEPPPATRLLVERLYNISIEDQISFEKSLPEIQLWSRLNFAMYCPNEWTTHYETYTVGIGDTWCPGFHEDRIRLKTFLTSFGVTTIGFTNDYYNKFTK